jgi:pyruvate dehydrogenase E1 component alpha subunit
VERARSGNGPSIVENETYRYKGHFEGDRQKYRSMDEIHMYRKKRDPIDKFERLLIEEALLTKSSAAKLRAEIAAHIEEAVKFGLDSPLPEPEAAVQDLFANP